MPREIVENPDEIDLEVAERMLEVFQREVDALPENSELLRPMLRNIGCWKRIAGEIGLRMISRT